MLARLVGDTDAKLIQIFISNPARRGYVSVFIAYLGLLVDLTVPFWRVD